MKIKKLHLNKEFFIGIILYICYIFICQIQSINIPDFVFGILLGFSVLFIVIGLLPKKIYNNIHIFKKNLKKSFENKKAI